MKNMKVFQGNEKDEKGIIEIEIPLIFLRDNAIVLFPYCGLRSDDIKKKYCCVV